jgi:uncharacterized membrane protein
LPFDPPFPGLLAVLALVLLCFAGGLLLLARPVERAVGAIDRRVAKLFPPYGLLRGIGDSIFRTGGQEKVRSALVEIEDALVPAFVVEELSDGRYAVFVPAAPNPMQGAVYIMARERVHLLDIGIARVARCASQWGIGSGELVKAMRAQHSS